MTREVRVNIVGDNQLGPEVQGAASDLDNFGGRAETSGEKMRAWGQKTMSAAAVGAAGLAVVASNIPGMEGVAIASAVATGAIELFGVAQTIVAGKAGIWAAAQWLLNAALWAFPVLAIVAGIAALVAGFIWAYQNVEWFRTGVDAVVQGVTAVVGFMVDNVGLILAGFGLPFVAAYLVVTTFGSNIASAFSTVVGAVAGFVGAAVGKLGEFLSFLGSLPGKAVAFIGDLVSSIKAPINGVIGLINNFIGKANGISITLPSIDIPFGPTIGGQTIGLPVKIPQIPQLARGGLVRREGMAWLHPAEVVVPAARAGAGGGDTYNVIVKAGVGDPVEIGKAVTKAIDAYRHYGGRGK